MHTIDEVKELLNTMGAGHMNAMAYDTGWLARLTEYDSELARDALGWIADNQLADGSWGAPGVMYYHDRIVSTLSAMIALMQKGRRAHDRTQIESGLAALERITSGATQGLASDPNGATVGFELICPTLIAEAEQLGIIKQQKDRILGRMKQLREQKMSKLAGMKINRHFTPAFSCEMAGKDGHAVLDVENLQESNGSIANSPSATAYFVSHVKEGDTEALEYLRSVPRERGLPFAYPFNVFERAWIIWNLSLSATLASNPEIQQAMEPHLSFLQNTWRQGQGIGFADSYTPCDADDTAVAHEMLGKYKNFSDEAALRQYEGKEYFHCYPLEANPSVSANIHILGALKQAGLEKTHPMAQKGLFFLRTARTTNGYWHDKWHISPYYSTSHMVIAALGYADELCRDAIEWMINTQKLDGSWGSFGESTAEETAYCIQALMFWQIQKGNINKSIIERASRWLEDHFEKPYPSLWIGKALYCPKFVVKSSILSALVLAKEAI
jgi:halimadienyl-diphosphate synthase